MEELEGKQLAQVIEWSERMSVVAEHSYVFILSTRDRYGDKLKTLGGDVVSDHGIKSTLKLV